MTLDGVAVANRAVMATTKSTSKSKPKTKAPTARTKARKTKARSGRYAVDPVEDALKHAPPDVRGQVDEAVRGRLRKGDRC
jgi:hypothetical protein